MLKSFNQGSTLPADFTQNYIKNIGNDRVFVQTRVSPGGYIFCVFCGFWVSRGHFGDNFGVLEHPEAPKGHAIDPKMPPGQDLENF